MSLSKSGDGEGQEACRKVQDDRTELINNNWSLSLNSGAVSCLKFTLLTENKCPHLKGDQWLPCPPRQVLVMLQNEGLEVVGLETGWGRLGVIFENHPWPYPILWIRCLGVSRQLYIAKHYIKIVTCWEVRLMFSYCPFLSSRVCWERVGRASQVYYRAEDEPNHTNLDFWGSRNGLPGRIGQLDVKPCSVS